MELFRIVEQVFRSIWCGMAGETMTRGAIRAPAFCVNYEEIVTENARFLAV